MLILTTTTAVQKVLQIMEVQTFFLHNWIFGDLKSFFTNIVFVKNIFWLPLDKVVYTDSALDSAWFSNKNIWIYTK